MAFLSVHLNPDPRSRPAIPFLLDIQAELLATLATRVVVPLYRQEAAPAPLMGRLTPRVAFQGQACVALFPELAGIARGDLGAAVGDLTELRAEILAALDLLFTGV